MRKKISFILAIIAFATPIIVGIITAVTEWITQSDTEYIANFMGGMMMGGAISLVFSVPSIILHAKTSDMDIIEILDILMILIGLLFATVCVSAILK